MFQSRCQCPYSPLPAPVKRGLWNQNVYVLVRLCKRFPIRYGIWLTKLFVFLLIAAIFVRTSPQDTPQGNNDRKFRRQIEIFVSVYQFAIIHFILSSHAKISFVERETWGNTKVNCQFFFGKKRRALRHALTTRFWILCSLDNALIYVYLAIIVYHYRLVTFVMTRQARHFSILKKKIFSKSPLSPFKKL